MVYIFGWIALYVSLILMIITRYRIRLFGYVAIGIVALIAIFRGSIGTDTATYELRFSQINFENFYLFYEPGFSLLVAFLSSVFGSPELGVRLVSVLFFYLIGYYFNKASKDEIFLLFSLYGPAFFFSYSMNGLRIGLASAILLIALQMLMRGKRLKSYILVGASFLFHYSISFSMFYLVMNFIRVMKMWQILLFSFGGSVIFLLISGTILGKFDAYSMSERPGELSGLSTVIAIALLVIGVLFSNLSQRSRVLISLVAICITSFMYFNSSLGYASLRFLNLISFALPITLLIAHQSEEKFLNRQTKVFIFLSGLVSVASLYRGWTLGYGEGRSPFLPYEFIQI